MSNTDQQATDQQTTDQQTAELSLDFFKGTGLPEEKEKYVRSQFETYLAQFKEWKEKIQGLEVNSVEDTANMALAKQARLALVKVRTAAEKVKQNLKADILKEGRVIDTIYNFIVDNIKPLEAELLEKESFAARLEEQRIINMEAARKTELGQYTDVSLYNLRELTEENYQLLLSTSKSSYENRLRIAEIEAENARLQAEAVAKEREAEAERQRIAAEAEAERQRVEAEKQAALAKAAEEEKARQMEIERLRWKRSDEIRPYYHYFTDDRSIKLGELSEEEYQRTLALLKQAKAKDDEIKAEQEKAEAERKRIAAEAEQERLRQEQIIYDQKYAFRLARLNEVGFVVVTKDILQHTEFREVGCNNFMSIPDAEFDSYVEKQKQVIVNLRKAKLDSEQLRREIEDEQRRKAGIPAPSTSRNANTDHDKILLFRSHVDSLPEVHCTRPEYAKIEKDLLNYKAGILDFIDKQLASIPEPVQSN
jgi:hypothetical protein